MVALIPDEFWPIAQRLLFFEEPALRWLHLKRWLKRRGVSPGQLTVSTSRQLELLSLQFNKLLEGRSASTAGRKRRLNQILTTLFAFEESKRFANSAFERWQAISPAAIDNKHMNFPLLGNEPERRGWINFLAAFSPDWCLLTESGSGACDVRGQFIRALLSQLEKVDLRAIKWEKLATLFHKSVRQWRADLPGHFLPDLVVLVEGTTETILLPLLAKRLGLDLDALGAMLIPAGGANQVTKKYRQLKESVSIPIFCLLDSDAHEQKILISSQLRPNDSLYALKEGEIEDLIKVESFVPLLNGYLSTPPYSALGLKSIQKTDFEPGLARTRVLERLWRERDLGKFDKVGFAKFVAQQSQAVEHISVDGRLLIRTLAKYKSK